MTSAKSKEITDEYISSLSDLTINSKPLINMLTMLADDNVEHAPAIVQAVETHLQKVRSDIKLPVLYLIDSIVKNVNGAYRSLFSQNIVNIFCDVFEKVDENTRARMWKLRQTWNEIFPPKKMFSLDVRVHSIDPAWPIIALPSSISSVSPGSIHVNPRFLSLSQTTPAIVPPVPPVNLPPDEAVMIGEAAMREELLRRQRELLELQKKKLELELMQATASLEQQERQLNKQVESIRTETTVPTLHVTPTMESTIHGKPVAPILPSQTSKHVTKQFPAATASLLKNSGVNNGPRIAPASSIAVASARPMSRDPRLKPSVSTSESTASNVDPRLRVGTGEQKESRLDNQSLGGPPPPPAHNVTNTVLSEQLKQQSKQAVTSTINKPPSNIASSNTSMINASNNNNGNTNLNNNNNNKNFSGNANKDAVSHRTSQKKDPRSSSNSSSSNNLNGNNSKVVQGQSLEDNNGSSTSSSEVIRGSGGGGDLKLKDKLLIGGRQSTTSSSLTNEKSSSASSKSSHRKLGNKSRSKQPQGSPIKVPKVERKNSPAPRSKSKEKDNEDSSGSIRTSPTQSSSQNLKNRKKNSSKSRKRSYSPSYRIPRCNDAKSNSSLSSSGGVTEEEQSGSLIVSPPHPPTFKEIRPNARQRNYVRRNRDGSLSPETSVISAATVQPITATTTIITTTTTTTEPIVDPSTKDEDLRSALPLPTPPTCVGASEKKEDMDLRVLAVGTNKRQSSEHLESALPKKTKAEKFDALFGNEDVDLRTLTHPNAGRPPTPPPPIISGEDGKDGWAKLKAPIPKGPREKQTSSSDEKRDRDRDRDRLGRPRLYSKLPDDPKERRRTLSSDDGDTRPTRRCRDSEKPERNADRNIEIIMKQALEQMNQGLITKVQYNNLIQEVLQMSEDQKLRAALRKEKEGTSIVWEKGALDVDRTPSFSPSSDNEIGRGKKESQMSRNANSGARWQGQQPWQSPGPWAHSANPFPGPQGHFNTDFRPVGPWQGPRHYAPIRPEFNQFHGGFNQNMGPGQRMGPAMMGPMGPNGPMMPNLISNGPMGPMGMQNAQMPPGIPMSNMNGPGSMMMNNGAMPPPNVLSNPNIVAGPNMSPNMPGRNISPNIGPKFDNIEGENDFGGTLVKSQGPHNRELPPPDPKILEEVSKDTMKSIKIDGQPREIRYYGETGVVFLSWDDPREIGFKDGVRRILIDDKDTVTCSFNGGYKEFMYEGEVHRIRLGAPTRELWVDDSWYEVYFGGPPVMIFLSGKTVSVKLEGPVPQVKIGQVKRTDLVVAKINLIINARNMVPVFLDAKPQIFEIEGKPNTLEFTDSLQTVLLNGRPFKVEFGGLPKPIVIRDKKHFIRFSVLPRGFRAGYVKIFGMRGESPIESPPTPPVLDSKANSDHLSLQQTYPLTEHDSASQDGSDRNATPKPDLQLDILSSVLPSAMAPSSGLSYQAEQVESTTAPATSLPAINMDELFQRLVATGIVPNINAEQKKQDVEEKKEPEIIPVSFDKPETLKVKQPAIAAALYSGMQCSSCGARFAPELATRYSHHLDWHFRQNRRERDSARKAHSRPWYYDLSDWIQYEEIEDLEDRAQSWFETEKQSAETEGATADDSPQETVQPSVPTVGNEDTQCQVCHDAFEQFYNEEKEEWHLRPAVNFEGKNYHPLCLEDFKRSMDDSVAPMEDTVGDMEEEKKENTENAEGEPKSEVEESNEKSAADESSEEPKTEKKEDENKNENDNDNKNENKTENENEEEDEEKKKKEEEESENKTGGDMNEIKVETENMDTVEKDSEKEVEEVGETPGLSAKIEAEDFTDVKIKEEPIDEEEIEDDGTEEHFSFENVEVKTEPIDPEPDAEETVVNEPALVDTTYTAVKSSIDGNVELESAPTALPTAPSRIKINITKPLTATKESEEPKDKPNPEIPDNVTPEILRPASIKQSLQGKKLSTLPPVDKGHELSGLCSIM